MVRSTCYAPGCKSGCLSDNKRQDSVGEERCSMFGCPKDPKILKKWQDAIPRADRVFSQNDILCELHFTEQCIARFFEHLLPDGSIHRLERGRPTLIKGAIPTIFPNVHSYLSTTVKKGNNLLHIPQLLLKRKKMHAETTRVIDPQEDSLIENDAFTFQLLEESLSAVKLPNNSWAINKIYNRIICSKWNAEYNLDRRLIIDLDLHIKVFLQNKEKTIHTLSICSLEDINTLLNDVDSYTPCAGINDININKNCSASLPECGNFSRKSNWCEECRKCRKNIVRRASAKRIQQWYEKLRKHSVCAERKKHRLEKKVTVLQNEIEALYNRCSSVKEEVLKKAINEFPQSQQECIRACWKAATTADGWQIRYTTQWVYECLLIRIKSLKAYNHLRIHKILALPSTVTLNKYLKRLQGVYGFQTAVFDCLKKKSLEMTVSERRGSLLIDEMKVSPTLTFDSSTFQFHGFTDLGKYTPNHQKTGKGGYALVFMFQPFRGMWVQSLACFLSKGAATGLVLHHLIMECIILLENSVFFVDVVTSDGATWNRNMWCCFGISDEQVSCSHICDLKRQLWFISDFPHLIKNVRNAITDKKYMLTPDGPVNIKYWKAVIEMDNPNTFDLKVCPKLTPDHIEPKHFMKMNVAMAFQFFSNSVASCMKFFKNEHPSLADSDGCVKFMLRFDRLIDVMNSRIPVKALKQGSESETVIKEFLKFLNEWETFAIAQDTNFMSESTCYGLKVSLKATLELLEFLSTKCDFKYLMTARLNQDSLERFFGMMRSACGSNDHPDSKVFIQVYRLISCYSLVKPPKGSNISGSDMLDTLVGPKQLPNAAKNPSDLHQILGPVIARGTDPHISQDPEHSYNLMHSSYYIVTYMAGWVARKAQRFSKCDVCKNYLVDASQVGASNILIEAKSKGWLLKPSVGLVHLIEMLEESTMKVFSTNKVSIDTFNSILRETEMCQYIPLIGCLEHQHNFTFSIMRFYLISRMHFICDKINQIDAAKSKKGRELRKLSKLT